MVERLFVLALRPTIYLLDDPQEIWNLVILDSHFLVLMVFYVE